MSSLTRLVASTITGDGDPDAPPYEPGVGPMRATLIDLAHGWNLIHGSGKLVVGNGVFPQTDAFGNFVPSLALYMVTGATLDDLDVVLTSEECIAFPDVSQQFRASAISAELIGGIETKLSAAGFDTSGLSAADSYGDWIALVGVQIDSGFAIENYPTD